MKVIFAGTPEFAIPTLNMLLASEHELLAVYTQPDRPAGRGRQLTPPPVKVLAEEEGIPVHQPERMTAEVIAQISAYQADVMIVVAYGMLLPEAVLQAPMHGCINVHASLLPRWRGAAPIQRAIEAGDRGAGVTIMQMAKGLDTGDMLRVAKTPISPIETSATLHDRLSKLGATALKLTMRDVANGALQPVKQNDKKATYAKKITKAEAEIDWTQSADTIWRKVMAFNPWPVCFFEHDGKRIRVWNARVIKGKHAVAPGSVLDTANSGITIACGKNALCITELQLPGGKRKPAGTVTLS